MLSTYLSPRNGVADDARTMAESTTSTGRGFRVSADLAAPPATSFLCCDREEGSDPGELLAAHGDSVLFEIVHRSERWSGDDAHDYFVYRAGAAPVPGRPRCPCFPPSTSPGDY